MKLKIASYNISGGFYNSDDKTEYLDKERAENIDNNMLQQIIETINAEDIDVICFQEIITTERIQYIQSICKLIQNHVCTSMFIAALFTIAKIWKPPKRPSTDEWIEKM